MDDNATYTDVNYFIIIIMKLALDKELRFGYQVCSNNFNDTIMQCILFWAMNHYHSIIELF